MTLYEILNNAMVTALPLHLEGGFILKRRVATQETEDGDVEIQSISIDSPDGVSILWADEDGEVGVYLPQEYTERLGILSRLPLDKEV